MAHKKTNSNNIIMGIKKIVTICGGNGGFSLLRGLKKFDWDISAIVAMTDDGGSTGRLRKELGVLPPGDVRYCLSALSDLPDPWEKVWNYRFESGGLKGHTAGNILLAGLEKFYGSFLEAVREMEKLLHVRGSIIPATLDNAELNVRLNNGKIIRGQNKINLYENLQREGVKKIFISPKTKANPKAVESIKGADIVLVGPGNLYCSILPTLVMKEVREALIETRALVVFNCNLVNRKDQTEHFDLDEYAKIINKHMGADRIDAVTIHRSLKAAALKKLCLNANDLVKYNPAKIKNRKYRVFEADLLDKECVSHSKSDAIAYLRSPVRHDGEKVGKAVIEIYQKMSKLKCKS